MFLCAGQGIRAGTAKKGLILRRRCDIIRVVIICDYIFTKIN